MTTKLDKTVETALADYLKGTHCAEAVLKYVAPEYAPAFDVTLSRMATPFGGGIAERGDICGALVGGLMVIGYISGRRNYTDNQDACWKLSREYYDAFKTRFGHTTCEAIHSLVYDRDTHKKCAVTVETAIRTLWDILVKARERGEI